jgi:opacity protein-like surface antigen
MTHCTSAALAAGMALAYATPAHASDVDFGYVYTAQTEEAHETEVELWATDRRGKGDGHYDAQDYRLEVEHGFTDRFQAAAYVNFASHHIHGMNAEFEPADREFGFQGLSAEFIYQLLSPKNDHWGVALYAEPGWSRISKVKGQKVREFELELKAIVQKNFAHDRLVWATNFTFEPEWEREHEEIAPGVIGDETEKEMAFEVATGLSYRVASRLWLGAEGRYHSVYPDWTHGLHRENYAVYAGPSVHYDGGKWALTATWQPQLFGSPNGLGSSLEYDDHERRELRLKFSYEF